MPEGQLASSHWEKGFSTVMFILMQFHRVIGLSSLTYQILTPVQMNLESVQIIIFWRDNALAMRCLERAIPSAWNASLPLKLSALRPLLNDYSLDHILS